jgi:hypothetical protein
MDFAPNEFGLKRPSASGRPAPTEKMPSASAEADAWRGAPVEADFNRREGLWPAVGLGRRMNSASRGLRPTVGLRRPKKCLLRRRRPTPGAERLERPISIGVGAFGRWSACTPNEFGLQRPSASGRPAPTEKCLLRRRRPTPGAERLGRPISIGVGAFGRWSACTPNEFGLQGPSANGRPAPTEKMPSVSAEADAWRGAPGEADFNRRGRLWPTVGLGRRMNSASRGLRPMVGLRRPQKCLLRRWRPTPGAERLERPISIGMGAFGRWSACTPNEFGLQRPSASGRPAPTGKGLFASAEADAWRGAS